LIFENAGTIVRKRSGLTIGFFNSGKIRRRRVISQEKGLTGESIEKEIVKKIERFPKCSLFKCR